ncbi:hypothetical protein [Mycobacterium sp. 852002-51057_SCH5723018]|uniref:hypothetical protein n=1 Tax=Mycobacterium sp. 852002-51057_SCH5723018 TaxID=1834094 RepID=UPI0007FE8B59|nr:hypothetical protein [Mycobacterium sp. 852002-51057_SCH5723018]OBG29116.1 hypothetical protein A5764_23285 [Mycobacterium sp. 852002-51057_SCH5723018]
MTYHVRNPIKWHGENPRGHFTIVPNELARDAQLSSHAYRIAIVIRTHAESYEVSIKSLAAMYRWGRGRTGKAIEELVAARWLAKRTYETVEGNRVFDEYHVHASRRFSEEESAMLNSRVVIRARPDPIENNLMSPAVTPRCAERHHLSVSNQDTKENQQEHQSENKEENQSVDCWICEGSGWFGGGPCENCCPPPPNLVRRMPEEQPTPAESCAGCKMFGSQGCFEHTSALIGRRQLAEHELALVQV